MENCEKEELAKLTNEQENIRLIEKMEENAKEKARKLIEEKEKAINSSIFQLIDLQLSKLELKVRHLEEFERFMQHEKAQVEVYQKVIASDRVQSAYKRKEFLKSQPFGSMEAEKPKEHSEREENKQKQEEMEIESIGQRAIEEVPMRKEETVNEQRLEESNH